MVALTNAQIRALKAQAQRLKATLKIGKEVLSTQFLAALNDVLKHHQLVKVKFDDFKERKKELASVVMGAGGLQRRRLLAADFACALGVPLCRSMISWVVSLASCGNRQGGFRDRTGGNGSPRFDTAIRYWLPVFGSFPVLLGSHCESGKVKNTSVGRVIPRRCHWVQNPFSGYGSEGCRFNSYWVRHLRGTGQLVNGLRGQQPSLYPEPIHPGSESGLPWFAANFVTGAHPSLVDLPKIPLTPALQRGVRCRTSECQPF
jgi:RNA-binding protein YhbY